MIFKYKNQLTFNVWWCQLLKKRNSTLEQVMVVLRNYGYKTFFLCGFLL